MNVFLVCREGPRDVYFCALAGGAPSLLRRINAIAGDRPSTELHSSGTLDGAGERAVCLLRSRRNSQHVMLAHSVHVIVTGCEP